MNDNILTVEQDLWLRDAGIDQTISPGDWYWLLENGEYKRHLCSMSRTFFRSDAWCKCILLSQLLDFVRVKAEEVWGDCQDGVDLYSHSLRVQRLNDGCAFGAGVDFGEEILAGVTAATPELALIALLDEIEKQRKVK